MTDERMPLSTRPDAELWSLCSAMCDGTIDEDGLARLELAIETDATNRIFCACYFRMNGQLMRTFRPNTLSRTMVDECEETGDTELIENEQGAAQEGRQVADLQSATSGSIGERPAPVIAPTSHFAVLGNTIHGTVGYFASGWPVAYLVAMVVFGIGLVVGMLVHVSKPMQIAVQPPLPGNSVLRTEPQTQFVGRITGMVDCQWVDPRTAVPGPVAVPLGRQYALASGLLEITYDTGAKVILQGPATFEVESAAGGYLSVGKLTARVEKEKAEGGRRKAEKTTNLPSPFGRGAGGEGRGKDGNRDQSQRALTLALSQGERGPGASSALPPPLSALFCVRTPTATVTDLGTEFGVEVGRDGQTASYVFRGSVKMEMLATNGDAQSSVIVLHENQAAQTAKTSGEQGVTLCRTNVDSNVFARRIARMPKTLDLLDIVAGGYGTTHRRERGVDATTGMEDPLFSAERRFGDATYKPVTWHRLIDGVFTPSGSDGPVVVDSAGHTFDGFPRTSRLTDASIWSRAASVRNDGREKDYKHWVYAMGNGRQYMPNNTGMLALATHMGITFNLEAMRTMYAGARPARFRATAALADASGLGFAEGLQVADVWVLVDGRPKLSRPQLRPQDGAVKVDVELSPHDRFLTLASTWDGNARNYDWVVFGDPVLEMATEEPSESVSNEKEVP